MADIEVLIIGAGIIGLSCGYELSKEGKSLYIIEKEDHHGRGISSRNSEVIHAGIYYPPNSLKSNTCIDGKHYLYEFLDKYNLPYIKRGKYIVATDKEGEEELYELYENAHNCDMKEIVMIDGNSFDNNLIKATKAIYSPTTGVFNVHYFMDKLKDIIKEKGNDIVYGATVKHIEKISEGFEITIKDTTGEDMTITAETVINAAGLDSAYIASFSGKNYKLYICKGTYFTLMQKPPSPIEQLIYPIPEKRGTGLGIHLTIDTADRMKLGPDTEYIKEENYKVDENKQEIFYNSVKTFLPWIKRENLIPDMAGIRPKLQGPSDDFNDYIIENINGFINLIGIESPGLTASLSIAKYVKNIL